MILLVTPAGFAPVLRHARTLITGTARANVEFPEGVESVRQLEAPELSKMAQDGYPLPAAARALVVTYRAVQAVKRQEAARIAKRRERAAERAQAVRDAKREAVEQEKRRQREADAKAKRAAFGKQGSQLLGTGLLPAPVSAATKVWDGSAPWN